ncbi:MAG TPA: penicillin-binding protein 1C, partial [Bacteroidia bacterium]
MKWRRRAFTWSLLFLWFWFCLPSQLFNDPTCTVLDDKNGNLMCAQIASDGQWRFPYDDSVPEKFEKCIVQFEDRSFYHHLGVNPLALAR